MQHFLTLISLPDFSEKKKCSQTLMRKLLWIYDWHSIVRKLRGDYIIVIEVYLYFFKNRIAFGQLVSWEMSEVFIASTIRSLTTGTFSGPSMSTRHFTTTSYPCSTDWLLIFFKFSHNTMHHCMCDYYNFCWNINIYFLSFLLKTNLGYSFING